MCPCLPVESAHCVILLQPEFVLIDCRSSKEFFEETLEYLLAHVVLEVRDSRALNFR